MRTIAQKYKDEGKEEGLQISQEKGIQIGQEKGKLEGEIEKALSIAKAMREKNYPLEDIVLLTGSSRSQIEQLI